MKYNSEKITRIKSEAQQKYNEKEIIDNELFKEFDFINKDFIDKIVKCYKLSNFLPVDKKSISEFIYGCCYYGGIEPDFNLEIKSLDFINALCNKNTGNYLGYFKNIHEFDDFDYIRNSKNLTTKIITIYESGESFFDRLKNEDFYLKCECGNNIYVDESEDEYYFYCHNCDMAYKAGSDLKVAFENFINDEIKDK